MLAREGRFTSRRALFTFDVLTRQCARLGCHNLRFIEERTFLRAHSPYRGRVSARKIVIPLPRGVPYVHATCTRSNSHFRRRYQNMRCVCVSICVYCVCNEVRVMRCGAIESADFEWFTMVFLQCFPRNVILIEIQGFFDFNSCVYA